MAHFIFAVFWNKVEIKGEFCNGENTVRLYRRKNRTINIGNMLAMSGSCTSCVTHNFTKNLHSYFRCFTNFTRRIRSPFNSKT